MKEMGFDFEVIPSDVSEFVNSYSSPADLVMQLAKMKGEAVYQLHQNALVLGFDTLVFVGGEPIGKPQSEEECINMIKRLSGKEHLVVTGAYLRSYDYSENFSSSCTVHIGEIPDEEIVKYAKTEEPYDKAGGYAVQGFVGRFIDKVDGDIFSVIGLPKALTYKKVTNYLKSHKEKE